MAAALRARGRVSLCLSGVRRPARLDTVTLVGVRDRPDRTCVRTARRSRDPPARRRVPPRRPQPCPWRGGRFRPKILPFSSTSKSHRDYDRIYSSYHLPWYMNINMRIDSLVFWFGLRKKLLYQTVLAYEFEYAWPWGPRVPGPRLSKDARSGSPVRGRAYARLVARDRRGVPYSYCYSHSRTPPTCDEIHTACCIHDTQGVCSPLQYTYRTGRIHTAHIRDSLSLTLCSHCVQCPHSARQAQPHTHENAWRRPQRPRHPSIALRSHDVKRLSNWRA